MDVDCLICFKSHSSADCPDRQKEHCPDCHVFVIHRSDHTAVCGSKDWLHNKYANFYARISKERCIINIDSPIRFSKDGCWRKASDDVELCSQGAIFRFKSNQDLSFSSTSFVPIRIAIVTKDKSTDNLVQKLVLLSSKSQFMVAVQDDKIFERKSMENNKLNTLILAISAEGNPQIFLNTFPKDKAARSYVLRYDQVTKQFRIPDGLKIGSRRIDEYGEAEHIHPQLEQRNLGAQCRAMANVYHFETPNRFSNIAAQNVSINDPNCKVCLNAHHSTECEDGILPQCFECHLPVRNANDHDIGCSVKNLFLSAKLERYVKILSTRCVITFYSPLRVLLDGNLCIPTAGMALQSHACDAFYRFETNNKVALMTTGYTRIRLPVIVQEMGELKEKIVLMTSNDRAIVAVNGSRPIVNENVLEGYSHNTPLVFYVFGYPRDITVEVHGDGGKKFVHEIQYEYNKFRIPAELDLKTQDLQKVTFDATLPLKKQRK